MKITAWTIPIALIFVAGWVANYSNARTSAQTNAKNEIERGKYLVEEVAKCTECHTPRDERGQLKKEAWLQGAPIWIMPVHPNPTWADHAPALAGLPGLTPEQGERVLEQGTGPQGEALRPPMHIYHLNHDDAKAIVSYLSSLKRSSSSTSY